MSILGRSLAQASRIRALQKRHNSIKALQAAFRDPSSPFHLPPGTQGPASPDELSKALENPSEPGVSSSPPSFDALLEQGRAKLVEAGFHAPSIWEQPIAWGDQDSFQHVNNVQYVRFFESSRIRWMTVLGHRLGGPAEAEALLKGKGVSLIIKALNVSYRRPVTYPDSLLIAHKPTEAPSTEIRDPAVLLLTSSAFSVKQQVFVAHCSETLVWYDYDNLRKCVPGEHYQSAVWEPFLPKAD